jgi:DNA-binding HxlR family transcriptional regulator
MGDLVDADVIVTRPGGEISRRSTEYELTAAGRELLQVAEIVERWLAESPNASRPLGGEGAKAAIGALVEGWSASLLRALAAKPLSIADLDSLIKGFNYPSLERRIAAMRLVGQVEAIPLHGRETPYGVTGWLRRGAAPLLAALHWERRHLAHDGVPVAGIDTETIFLLAMPLLALNGEVSGACRLAVELPDSRERRLAGALVELRRGSVVSRTSRLDGSADAWTSGSVAAWFRALNDDDATPLSLGGDESLARSLVSGLHRALFESTARKNGSDPRLEDLAEPALQRRRNLVPHRANGQAFDQ